MRHAHADSVLVDVLTAGAARPQRIDLEVGLVDRDVDILGLGQHRNGRGRGVNAARASVSGTRCTRCTPDSNLSLAKAPRPRISAITSL